MVGLDNPIHIAFLLVIVLLVFGAKRLPEMGRSLGSGLRGFKEAISGDTPIEHSVHMTAASQELPRVGEEHAAPRGPEPAASAVTDQVDARPTAYQRPAA